MFEVDNSNHVTEKLLPYGLVSLIGPIKQFCKNRTMIRLPTLEATHTILIKDIHRPVYKRCSSFFNKLIKCGYNLIKNIIFGHLFVGI
jgi:hypothetical protein